MKEIEIKITGENKTGKSKIACLISNVLKNSGATITCEDDFFNYVGKNINLEECNIVVKVQSVKYRAPNGMTIMYGDPKEGKSCHENHVL